MKNTSGKNIQHDNITIFGKLSGVSPDKLEEKMKEIYLANLPGNIINSLPRNTLNKLCISQQIEEPDLEETIDRGTYDVEREYLNMAEANYKGNMFKYIRI